MLIAADIGGTKTNLALFEFNSKSFEYLDLKTYKSSDYDDLETIIKRFISEVKPKKPVQSACFAIAGPVVNGVCHATNLPWIVDEKKLAAVLGISDVYLINDLEGNAWAIDILSADQLMLLHTGDKQFEGNRAVVSPGTGLGEAGVLWDGKMHHPFASEGGHCELGPLDEVQIDLCRYLYQKFGHPSYERVLSGPGLANIYAFFIDVQKRKEPKWLTDAFAKEDPARVITENALNGKSELCLEVLDLFISILGSEAGNCVLKYMAFGGLYLGGGIPPKILPRLKDDPGFLEGFFNKGRFRSLLEKVPVYVILDDKAALRGSANYCRMQEVN
ncbi:MAG: Glucokinase [Chlamydiales bacterium]|nr:Glucokinase [Chlamydiales bacterium]MCH9620465.1 Glucokinase [Chlamydiales bacterium]MCH9623451.1 Glucokinase [Chlamydiales bacterium]